MLKSKILSLACATLIVPLSCKKQVPQATDVEVFRNLTKAFRSYWYMGSAEINSFVLSQERYGELRDGEAVLIFVTEDFLKDEQVKANIRTPEVIPVLKFNSTKSFQTGIYPYSVMQSAFYPVRMFSEGLKVTSSVQEWCGQTYTQLNNRENFEIKSHSYFEGEADQEFELESAVLENSIWTLIRINPEELPLGTFSAIPDIAYLQMYHKPLKSYQAHAELSSDSLYHYKINYPKLNRSLNIDFETTSPFKIVGWQEVQLDKGLSSVAQLKASVQLPYWQLNKAKDSIYRNDLKLN